MPVPWDHPLADMLDDARERTQGSRYDRAVAGRDRVARLGAASLARGGMHATVVDPSFGDDARAIHAPLASGHSLVISGPHPDPASGEGTSGWHAAVNPAGTDYHVGGEELHRADLGTFHPRELHDRVQSYLGSPEVMRAVSGDSDRLVGQMERQGRNAARATTVAHMGEQFRQPRP